MIGGLGVQELLVVLIIALFLFGGKKLPEIGQSLGRALRSFKEGSEKALDDTLEESKPADSETRTEKEDEEASQSSPSDKIKGPEDKPAQESGASGQEEKEPAPGS
jgi:sec-independent protein translocase protein TatA